MRRTIGLMIAMLMLGVGMAWAEEQVIADSAAAQSAPAQQTAADKDKQAMMDALKERGSPNENHKALAPLVGRWTYTAQWWMSPDSQPQSMTGASVNTLIFGDRFLKQDVTGTTEGQPPFEGLGIVGYDNIRKEYQSLWCDNMATGMMWSAGQFDAATNTLTQEGDFSCPITGEAHRWFRTAWSIIDSDHNRYQSYSRTPDGKEFKSLEILYTRAQ